MQVQEDVDEALEGEKAHSAMFIPLKFRRFEVLPPVLCTRRAYVQVALLLVIGLLFILAWVLSTLRATFVHVHLESDTDGELVILPAEFSHERGAVCLDGSPPAYYHRQSAVPLVNFWIIHLQGGGWCTTAEECFERHETALGSSLRTQISKPLDGILSSDCSLNPDFCLWHVVDLLYCDGGSFLGNRTEPLAVNSELLYMRGARVFDALLEYLASFTLLKDAEQIILAGSSSSGLGALIHADRLRKRLPSSVKTLHVLIDGSLFIDIANRDEDHDMARILQNIFYFHHAHKTTSVKECTEMAMNEESWRCLLPEVFHSYVFTPIFFINSLYDTWYRKNALNIDCPLEVCPDTNAREVLNARIKLLQTGQELLQSKKNGVFFMSCPAHSVLTNRLFSAKMSGQFSVQQGVGSWINDQGSSTNVVEVLEVADALRTCPTNLTSWG